MQTITLVLFGVGLVLLVAGAEALVRGASRIATMAGIPPLIVGLTVVSFGTSAPELAVSVQAALGDKADIALGNVIGSNIANVLLILGLSALVAPLAVSRQLVRLDVPVMIGVSLLLWLLALDGQISWADGLILLLGVVGYTGYLVIQTRQEHQANNFEVDAGAKGGARAWLISGLLVVVGLAMLVQGSNWLVVAAVQFAAALGVSELVIGLTVVALGTSLPELATSVVAALRGQRDIAVGNVVGSNIYNILLILGSAAAVGGGIAVAPGVLFFDLPVILAVAIACLPIFFTGYEIARWEGAVFVGYYVAYVVYIFLATTQHSALSAYSVAMLGFVAPITAITLGVLFWRSLQARQRAIAARRKAAAS